MLLNFNKKAVDLWYSCQRGSHQFELNYSQMVKQSKVQSSRFPDLQCKVYGKRLHKHSETAVLKINNAFVRFLIQRRSEGNTILELDANFSEDQSPHPGRSYS